MSGRGPDFLFMAMRNLQARERRNGRIPEARNSEVLLRAGKHRIESLTNLGRLPTKGAKLVFASRRVKAASAPARVIAILP
jgi:kynurenine formamidase